MRRALRIRLVLAACAMAAAACRLDEDSKPARPVIHYSLSEATTAIDAKTGEPVVATDVQANIAGSLQMLFGTPSEPHFLRLPEWKEAGYDPNWPTYAKDDSGGGEFDEAALAALAADNARYFRLQLASIDAGDYDEVFLPDWSLDLQRKWSELLASKTPTERGEDFKKDARALFEGYYPNLRSSAELYRQHCLHCHGPEGGGNGPTARFLNPRPRDYRLGTFKFTAVGKSVPRRRDLFHILDEGVTGTAMPSFRRFAKSQLQGLVDYVRLLSMRGMVEHSLVGTFAEEEALTSGDVLDAYTEVWAKWDKAGSKMLVFEGQVPPPTPASIARGSELFMDAKTGNCFSCHGADGRGDGASAFAADPQTGRIVPTYKDDWGNEIVPRNLRYGVFRGGRRPIDIYRRIKNGIAGTPMPEAASGLSDDDIWAMVHYVGSLSEYPRHVAAGAHETGIHDAGTGEHGAEIKEH